MSTIDMFLTWRLVENDLYYLQTLFIFGLLSSSFCCYPNVSPAVTSGLCRSEFWIARLYLQLHSQQIYNPTHIHTRPLSQRTIWCNSLKIIALKLTLMPIRMQLLLPLAVLFWLLLPICGLLLRVKTWCYLTFFSVRWCYFGHGQS